MSPATAKLLIDEVLPRIRSAVPNAIKRVGCEDVEELIQDTAAQAAYALESCENRGVPIYPASVAFYAIQRAKSGRRANYAGRADVLSSACQLDGRSALSSMDEPIPSDTEGDELTLHDVLGRNEADPAEQAARELDWEPLLAELDARKLAILRTVAEGGTLNRLAKRFGISNPRITQLKSELAKQIKGRLGNNVLADVIRRPRWAASTYAQQQADACRHARAKASAW